MTSKAKQCAGCGQERLLEDFGRDKRKPDGRRYCCKECEKKRWSAWVAAHREQRRATNRRRYSRNKGQCAAATKAYRFRHPWIVRVGHKVYRAMCRGDLVRKPCEVCGQTENIVAHHENYNKPLKVRWLCKRHHKLLHRGELALLPIAI